jgi:prophage tail gpP-like protein
VALKHEVALVLLDTGRVVDVWDKYDVTLDMLTPGSPWTFSLWRSDERFSRNINPTNARTAWTVVQDTVKVGGQIAFVIDGAVQLNGRIESYDQVVDEEGEKLVISGRDLSGLALDWDADPRINLRNTPLETCLEQLFNRVGVSAIVTASADAQRNVQTRRRPGARSVSQTARRRRRARVDYSHARPDERVWQVAESIVKRLGLMMWVAPSMDGLYQMAVVVDVPDYDQAATFVFGRVERDGVVSPESNVLKRGFKVQIRDIPTHVYAMGQAARGDSQAARHRVDYPNEVLARWPIVVNPMPPQIKFLHTPRAKNPRTARQEAARYTADKMRDFRVYQCTVQGHGQTVDGEMRLYAVNTMARVYDVSGERQLVDEDMLITRVQFSGSPGEGQKTQLVLGTKGAIVLEPDE